MLLDAAVAPLFYAGPRQINAQVPYEIAGQLSAQLQVIYQGVTITSAEVASTFEGDRLASLVRMLGDLEEPLQILERRGMSLPAFFRRVGPAGLPIYRVLAGGQEHWFSTSAEVDAFRKAEQERLGGELVVADESPESHTG